MKKQLPALPPKEKQITYAVVLNAKTPYELYLDDIMIDYSNQNNMNNTIELNPYLLNNGKHYLKIKFFPPIDNEDSLLHPKNIVFDKDTKWKVYFTTLLKDKNEPLGYSNSIDYKNSELDVRPPPEKMPFWEQVWDLNIDQLPYDLQGWKNGTDLSKMDSIELEKQVVAFFQNQWSLLNEGKTKEYLALGEKKDKEIAIATYDNDPDWYNSPERVQNLLKAKDNMLPLSNYKMAIYAKGRLVTLKIVNGKYKNWSALISRSETGKTSGWGILLTKPKGSNAFEIIRK